MAHDDEKPPDAAAPTLRGVGPSPAVVPVAEAATLSGDPAAAVAGRPPPSSPPVVVRAGKQEDYRELVAIDPQHYVVGDEIARGGMGRILAARDRRLGRPVAIKELLVTSGDLRARFEREARITAKLQHPAIVSIVEAGVWPGGEPFYVMKLVTGESLDRVIHARPTLEARLGLLANVIAAVDALAYAHSHQIIHRDLKPSNVLVGEFGETVVIDWGLAKDLADASAAAEPSAGPYRTTASAPGQTQAGSVMGTPAYMPEEQARGAVLDARADVYALGAMLYHVLAGKPPYAGTRLENTVEAVVVGPPPPLAQLAPGVPRDLVAIVEKAMARAAADRYPTAKGLADDLKKFQTGQLVGAHQYSTWQLLARWVRRYRAPVAVGAAALVLLAVLGGLSLSRIVREQARTEAQRRAAEASRGDAEDLMSFMLVDLRDKLTPLGKLELLDAVAQKAVKYYEARTELGGPDEQSRRAVALTNIGDVLLLRGDLAGALTEHRAALAIRRRFATLDPGSVRWQADLAMSHERIGSVLLAQGDAPGALAAYRESLAILERLVAREPDNGDVLRNLAVSHSKIGDVLYSQGDLAGALDQYRASLTILDRLVARDPDNAKWRRGLAGAHENVGEVLVAQGDLGGALAAYRASLALRDRLADDDPANAGLRRDLTVVHNHLGDALYYQGDLAAALVEYRTSKRLAEQLVAQDPGNSALLHTLSICHDNIGDVLDAQGDVAGMLEAYQSSLAIRQQLALRDPTNAGWQRALAISYDRVGTALQARGELAAALVDYQAALSIREQLVAKDASNTTWLRDLADSYESVGGVLMAQGQPAAALVQYLADLAITSKLATKDATNLAWQDSLAVSHTLVGDALLATGDTPGALEHYRASLAIEERLAAKDAANAGWQEHLATSHSRLGDGLRVQGDRKQAGEHYRAAVALLEPLAAHDPTNADLGKALAELRKKVNELQH